MVAETAEILNPLHAISCYNLQIKQYRQHLFLRPPPPPPKSLSVELCNRISSADDDTMTPLTTKRFHKGDYSCMN